MSQEISFIVAFAAVFGSAEAIRQTQAKTRRQEHRSRKNNLLVHCVKSSRHSAEIEGRHVILSGEKVCTILSYHAFFIFLFLLEYVLRLSPLSLPRRNARAVRAGDWEHWAETDMILAYTRTQLYVDTGTEWDVPFGHQFAGYYMPFPDTQFEGLVTTICDDPPIM